MRTEVVVDVLTGNVVTRTLTEAENAALEEEESKFLEQLAIVQAKATAADNAKQSALSKLMALGLTEQEVKALLGSSVEVL